MADASTGQRCVHTASSMEAETCISLIQHHRNLSTLPRPTVSVVAKADASDYYSAVMTALRLTLVNPNATSCKVSVGNPYAADIHVRSATSYTAQWLALTAGVDPVRIVNGWLNLPDHHRGPPFRQVVIVPCGPLPSMLHLQHFQRRIWSVLNDYSRSYSNEPVVGLPNTKPNTNLAEWSTPAKVVASELCKAMASKQTALTLLEWAPNGAYVGELCRTTPGPVGAFVSFFYPQFLVWFVR